MHCDGVGLPRSRTVTELLVWCTVRSRDWLFVSWPAGRRGACTGELLLLLRTTPHRWVSSSNCFLLVKVSISIIFHARLLWDVNRDKHGLKWGCCRSEGETAARGSFGRSVSTSPWCHSPVSLDVILSCPISCSGKTTCSCRIENLFPKC